MKLSARTNARSRACRCIPLISTSVPYNRSMLIRNVKLFDATGAAPYPAEVLIEGNRIAKIARSQEGSLAQPGMRILDGAGATLMPGLVEAHAHLTWPSSVEKM